MSRVVLVLSIGCLVGTAAAGEPKGKSAREALRPFNLLVGSWKGTGTPDAPPDERQKGHWTETVAWEWHFKGEDAWLTVKFERGKHFTSGELRYVPATDDFELTLTTVAKNKHIYRGAIKGKQVILERPLEDAMTFERLTWNLLHDNRVTYRLETRRDRGTTLTRKYLVGLTKEGEPFANVGRAERECVVSGGLGTIVVSHDGKTYYVCCSGCRDEFRADPARYVKEWEARRKK